MAGIGLKPLVEPFDMCPARSAGRPRRKRQRLPTDHRTMPERRCTWLEAFDGNAIAFVFALAVYERIASHFFRSPTLMHQALPLGSPLRSAFGGSTGNA